jgi:probable lipoprotein NlpC
MKLPFKLFTLVWLIFFTNALFAAVPIQERSLSGAAAAEARLKLISIAETFLGTPYRYSGLDKRGLDCSGLVYLSFKEGLGITVPRTAESIYSWVEKIATQELQPGDLVFFVTTGSKVSHLGIYTGEGRFIHSASAGTHTGVMYSQLDETYWKRSYLGAGRALPWDDEAAEAMKTAPDLTPSQDSTLSDSGFFVGFGAAWTWGGFFEGAPSPFRGISALATAGYAWSGYRAGLELRPEWDRALGVFRLPFTLSFGTDIFQVFVGPAYTLGEPSLNLQDGNRDYQGGRSWLWELGFSAAIPPIWISQGALSFYGELAWQPYHWDDESDFSFKPDITANLRLSTGLRYLWRL